MHRHTISVLALSFLLAAAQAVLAQPAQWVSFGAGGGGAFYLPSFSPHAASEYCLTSDMSGVYRTTDFGASWSTFDWRKLQGSGSRGLVQYTSNPGILYVLNAANDVVTPSKSTDGGVTWSALPADPAGGGAFSLWADPRSTTKLLVSDYTTLYFSTDGGSTFASKFTSNVNGAGCHVAGVLFDSLVILVGTNAGVVASTDGGSTFSVYPLAGIPATEAIVSFSGARSGSLVRLYCVTLGVGDVYPGVTGADHATYRSVYTVDLGQLSWTPRVTGIASTDHPFYVGCTRGAPMTAYLGGGSSGAAPIVYKTTNGGVSWTSVFQTSTNQNIATGWSGAGGDRNWSYGEYALGFAVSPIDSNRVAITDLGFVHETSDGGTSWRQAYVLPQDQNPAGASTPTGRAYHGIGLENTSGWWMMWHDSLEVFAASTDIRGIRSTDGGLTWSFNYSGHTLNTMYHITRHPVSGTYYASTSSVHDLYQSTYLTDARIDGGTGQVLYASGGFGSWSVLHNFGHPVTCTAADPTSPTRLYASVVHSTLGGIYMTSTLQNGASSTWTKLANPPRTQGHPFMIHVLKDGTVVCSFSGRRSGSPLAFTASSGVFVSTDHGTTWIDRSSPALQYWTKDVVIDPADTTQNTWYAGVYSGWGGPPNGLGGLYRTTDRGLNWTKLFASDGVESCTVRPDNTSEMYVTTETQGLMYTSNARAASPAFSSLAPYPFKQPERVFFDPYHAGHVWVSSFGGGLRRGIAPVVPVELASFEADVVDGRSVLRWRTESERDNAGFDVQRRLPDERSWMTLAFVPGQGTTTAAHSYAFIDAHLGDSDAFLYRLLQRDYDGSATPSHEVLVRRGADASAGAANALSVAPMPLRDDATVSWCVARAGDTRLTVHDLLGRTVATLHDGWIASGVHTSSLRLSGLPAGTYIVLLRSSDGTRTARVQHVK